ncbi:hypothetical protein LIER_25550 [Lithospermum erythrorhizon]|uniref:Uncharacterized protein n=1 Tax=Lithospermum erythrorhizon TaxID=34254 RepID=A0AAV3R561_LITER
MPPKSKNTSKSSASKPAKRNTNKQPSKRSRRQSSSDEDERNVVQENVFILAIDNAPIARGGKHVKTRIHLRGTCSLNDLQGTMVWEIFSNQDMIDFLTFSHDVHPELVHWFYKHARVTAAPNDTYVCLVVDGKNDVPPLKFDSSNFDTLTPYLISKVKAFHILRLCHGLKICRSLRTFIFLQRGLPIDDDNVQNVQGEDVHVEREDIWTGLRKSEGTSSRAQAYLDHSDYDQEVVHPQTTTTPHHTPPYTTQKTSTQTSGGTPVCLEHYGFRENAYDDGDGGMGFFLGPYGGV